MHLELSYNYAWLAELRKACVLLAMQGWRRIYQVTVSVSPH